MTRQEELVQAARKEYPEWEEAQCHFIDGAHYADSHPHWTSVEELPKIGEDVLVLRKDGEMQVAHQYNETIARWWSVDGFPLKNNITHWMPLPQAPILSDSSNIGKDLKGGEE